MRDIFTKLILLSLITIFSPLSFGKPIPNATPLAPPPACTPGYSSAYENGGVSNIEQTQAAADASCLASLQALVNGECRVQAIQAHCPTSTLYEGVDYQSMCNSYSFGWICYCGYTYGCEWN